MARVQIRSSADVTRAILLAAEAARSAGFGEADANMIATTVSELAHNIVKYAQSGSIDLDSVEEGQRNGLRVTARDRGPGIDDISLALKDHYSTSGTLGLGLPGVKRMAHDFHLESGADVGTNITAHFWLDEDSLRRRTTVGQQDSPPPNVAEGLSHASNGARVDRGFGGVLPGASVDSRIDAGYFIRPCFGERVSGDDVVLERRADLVVAAVIDGLGHGTSAHDAAVTAKQFLRSEWTSDPADAIRQLGDAMSDTVGAAVGMAVVNLESREIAQASVGNTTMRILGESSHRFPAVEGIVGEPLSRSPVVSHGILGSNQIAVLHSDGLSDRFGAEAVSSHRSEKMSKVAKMLVAKYGKNHDDASCIALRLT